VVERSLRVRSDEVKDSKMTSIASLLNVPFKGLVLVKCNWVGYHVNLPNSTSVSCHTNPDLSLYQSSRSCTHYRIYIYIYKSLMLKFSVYRKFIPSSFSLFVQSCFTSMITTLQEYIRNRQAGMFVVEINLSINLFVSNSTGMLINNISLCKIYIDTKQSNKRNNQNIKDKRQDYNIK